MPSLFIFRRDLRVDDNRGLQLALQESDSVIPCFIFTPDQIEKNPYRSDFCLQFMLESLEDLEAQLRERGGKLFLFFGEPEKIVEKLLQTLKINSVFVGRDYTPYSLKRDQKIGTVCKKHKVPFVTVNDVLLNAPEETLKSDGKPYAIFTPYFRNASKIKVDLPRKTRASNYFSRAIAFAVGKEIYREILPKRNPHPLIPGGREAGLKILKHLAAFKNYGKTRDFPAENGTTHLSAYLKFTALSPREVYHQIGDSLGTHHELIRALYWRDFFSHIAFFFPRVFQGAFHEKYNHLKWSSDEKLFQKWCEGKTGFPIVDAGMRELNATGFMHNRVRMIVASFLTKDLHIDWRWGEKYFAQKLIDYDPAVNNGNWQWAASTGCDAQPYFRIFNPWSQQEKFDPEGLYIQKWVPEFASLKPIVDHATEAKKALQVYKRV